MGKLITNGHVDDDKSLNHLIGFYDRLESLYIDTPLIIPNGTRMISLKQLTVRLYQNDEELESKYENLNGFPNLESFKCVYINEGNRKYQNLNGNIQDFINYLSK